MSERQYRVLVSATVKETAQVADSAHLGDGTTVWELAQVREDAQLGENCIVGRGAYVGKAVRMGDHCKLQNYALVYEPATLGDGVFIGPAAVLTNDQYPRAVAPKVGSRGDTIGNPSASRLATARPSGPERSASHL